MGTTVVTEYFHVDKSRVGPEQINEAIREQYSKWKKNYTVSDDQTYQLSFYGVSLSYDIEEVDSGYKVHGEAAYSFQTYLLLFLGLLLSFIGIIFVVIGIHVALKQFENSVKKAKDAFNASSSALNGKSCNLDELEKLHSMKVKGILTEDEFNQKKSRLLA